MTTNDYEKAKKIAEHLHSIAQGQPDGGCEEFEQWVVDNPSAYGLMQKLSDPEELKALLRQMPTHSGEESFKELQQKRRNRTIRRYVRNCTAVAAIAIIFITAGYYLFRTAPQTESCPEYTLPQIVMGNGDVVFIDRLIGSEESKVQIIETADGELIQHKQAANPDTSMNRLILPAKRKYTIQLSDGSKVTVNANSTFSYPTVFYGKERRVEIQGEAFFEVAKGDKPFIVSSSGVEIQAYGTSFNVNNYAGKEVETVLVTGSVGVTMQGKAEVRLCPNQKALADLSGGTISREEIQPETYIAWLQGYFIFEGENLDKVLEKMGAWYGVEFDLSALAGKKIPIVAKYNQNTPLEEILQTIEFSTQLKFTDRNGKIRIETTNT